MHGSLCPSCGHISMFKKTVTDDEGVRARVLECSNCAYFEVMEWLD